MSYVTKMAKKIFSSVSRFGTDEKAMFKNFIVENIFINVMTNAHFGLINNKTDK